MSHFLKRYPIFVLCFLVGAFGTQLSAQTGGVLKVIKIDGKNVGPASSAGVLANQTLYVAGQDGRNADGSVPKEFQQEVSQSLSNVQGVLRAAGMDFGNAVWMHIYVTNVQDIAGMDEVYWKTIGANPPARTVLVVGALPNGEKVEINCIAVASTSSRRVIHPQGWPQGPHIDPPGIQADDVLYLSAQGGTDPMTGKIPADFSAEVKQALDNVAAVLKAAGMSMANVVWVNPYLNGAQSVMNRVYATYFEFGNTPGRGTIQVMDLPKMNHVVFSCIAGADLAKRKSVQTKIMSPSPTASPGVLYGDTLYLSAKSGSFQMQGSGSSSDLDVQTRLSMRNLLDGLLEADMNFSNVVSSTIYVREIKEADQVQTAYGNIFRGNLPARTTLQQNLDTQTAGGEQISFIAVKQPKQ